MFEPCVRDGTLANAAPLSKPGISTHAASLSAPMSNDPDPKPDSSSSPQKGSSLPDGVPPPPPPVPNPDLVDPRKAGPTYGGTPDKKKRRKKGKQGMTHPTDLHHSKPPKSARRGCCGCLAAVSFVAVLLVAALLAAVAWYGPGRYAISEDYRVVTFNEDDAVITEAPTEATLYMGRNLLYEVEQTRVPVAFFAVEVVLNGDFWEDTSATATRVVGGPTARFAKNLEVFALEFEDQGVDLRGELRGRVTKSTQ